MSRVVQSLYLQGVAVGAQQGLHLAILIQGLEAALNLPALLIGGADSVRGKSKWLVNSANPRSRRFAASHTTTRRRGWGHLVTPRVCSKTGPL